MAKTFGKSIGLVTRRKHTTQIPDINQNFEAAACLLKKKINKNHSYVQKLQDFLMFCGHSRLNVKYKCRSGILFAAIVHEITHITSFQLLKGIIRQDESTT